MIPCVLLSTGVEYLIVSHKMSTAYVGRHISTSLSLPRNQNYALVRLHSAALQFTQDPSSLIA